MEGKLQSPARDTGFKSAESEFKHAKRCDNFDVMGARNYMRMRTDINDALTILRTFGGDEQFEKKTRYVSGAHPATVTEYDGYVGYEDTKSGLCVGARIIAMWKGEREDLDKKLNGVEMMQIRVIKGGTVSKNIFTGHMHSGMPVTDTVLEYSYDRTTSLRLGELAAHADEIEKIRGL